MIIIEGLTVTQEQCQGCCQQVVFNGHTIVFWTDDKEYAAYRFLFLYGYDSSEYLQNLIDHTEFAIEFDIVYPNEDDKPKTLVQRIWQFWFPPKEEKWPDLYGNE